MFGLVRPYYKKMIKQEKCEYKCYYCGLCMGMGRTTGLFSRFLINYDVCLAYLVADSISLDTDIKTARCPFSLIRWIKYRDTPGLLDKLSGIDNSFQGCQNAVAELHKAIKLDPSNEAYIGLLDAISEQIRDYEQRQRDKAAQDERDRQEQERRSQQAVAAAQRRRFWNSAGPCLGGLASLGFVALMCWCGCECCKSSGCGACC